MAPLLILFGISAVGKTTAAEALASIYPEILTFQASSLLKEALDQPGEVLRTAKEGEITSNQLALTRALEMARRGSEHRPAVLDAHSVIDNDKTLVELPLETFAHLHPQGMAMLIAPPLVIAKRRATGERVRPERSIDELARHQDRAEAVARSHALALDVPFAVFEGSDHHALSRFAATILGLRPR